MTKHINMAVIWLAEFDGLGWLNGGMERWCRDVALLCASKGYTVTIYQKAKVGFELSLADGVRVVGIPTSLSFRGNWMLYKYLTRHVARDEPMCFVSQEISLGNHFRRAVAVNHGIWWDGDQPLWKRWLNKRLQYSMLLRLRGVICVDTNFINWCHAELPNRYRWDYKLHYVPNYADLNLFRPSCRKKERDELLILFARRVSDALDERALMRQGRGAGLLLRAAEVLHNRGIRFRLLFAGRDSEGGTIAEFARSRGWGDRVETFEVAMDDMPNVYARADVAVVPSLEHEGTSMSAIEGLACGIPTVVSHIGGLCNIVVPGLNGTVADLTPESLADAIQVAAKQRLLDNPGVLEACRSALGKDRWERQVWTYMARTLDL